MAEGRGGVGEGRAGQGERPRDCRRPPVSREDAGLAPRCWPVRLPPVPAPSEAPVNLRQRRCSQACTSGEGGRRRRGAEKAPAAEAAGSRSSSVCGMSPGPASAGRRLGSEAGITPSRVQDAVDVTSDQAVRFTQIHREAGAERSCCRCGPRRLVREILRCPKCL